MNRRFKKFRNTILGVLLFWTLLTLFAQFGGKESVKIVGDINAPKKALIIYNADPIYNLDAQICENFAYGLSNFGIASTIATVKNASKKNTAYDLYVFCTNTYNWAPDWQITRYIKEHTDLTNKDCIAITLGAGATERSKRIIEKIIINKNANLVASRTYWLLKPNDDNRLEEKNVIVANDMARKFGEALGKELQINNR